MSYRQKDRVRERDIEVDTKRERDSECVKERKGLSIANVYPLKFQRLSSEGYVRLVWIC